MYTTNTSHQLDYKLLEQSIKEQQLILEMVLMGLASAFDAQAMVFLGWS
jgi:hypothetical protein